MADDATITLDITMLPDDISKTLEGEAFSYTPADSTEGWFYKLMAVTNSSVDLISKETFLQKGSGVTGTDTGAVLPNIHGDDKIKFLFIKHTSVTQDGTTANTADSIYLIFDGGIASHASVDAVEIGPGESWYAKFNGLTVNNLHCISALKAGAGTSTNKIQALVVTVIDDVT